VWNVPRLLLILRIRALGSAGFGALKRDCRRAISASSAAILPGCTSSACLSLKLSLRRGWVDKYSGARPVPAQPARPLTSSGGMIRPHGDQLLDDMHFAANEDDVKKLNLCTVRRCRFEVAGVEAQRRTE
jgi:hypothetical protein